MIKPEPKPAQQVECDYDDDALTLAEMVNLQQAASELARKAREEAAQRRQPPADPA